MNEKIEIKENDDWKKPNGSSSGIFVLNSLTHQKEELITNGKYISMYTCGPTVYDCSHMGHARSYIGFDIVRRLLEDYFQYDVQYVVNITDF